MLNIKIAPSILAADFANLGAAVEELEKNGADMIHCDVMDGQFVHPITFGSQMVEAIRKHTTLPLDVHLMAEHPQTLVADFANAGADILSVHYEACRKFGGRYLYETLQMIRSYGKKSGVVISPYTHVSSIHSVLPVCDMVLLMSVVPGYGGQKFKPETLDRIAELREMADVEGFYDLDIEVDGGINEENVGAIKAAGANVIVAGSAVFKSADMRAAIEALRNR